MCPYCGEEISMILDFSVPSQVYIEDCEVCCSPIEISYSAEDDELTSFRAKRLEKHARGYFLVAALRLSF